MCVLYTVCILYIRHWHLKLQCAQHCAVTSHEIITSVFHVVVVAVVVLQLHILSKPQHYPISTVKMNINEPNGKREWRRTTEEKKAMLWFWCLRQNYSNSFQSKGRIKEHKENRGNVMFSDHFSSSK